MTYEFIVKNKTPFESHPQGMLRDRKDIGGGYEVVYVQAGQFDINDLLFYPYEAIPKVYSPLSVNWEEAGCIASIQANPALSLSGNGIILGIVDSGIDITNEAFQFIGGRSRVGIFWNQEKEQVYTREEINGILETAVAGEWDDTGHGSYVAGLAAGTGGGIAPDVELAVVKLAPIRPYLRELYQLPENGWFYQENDIMAGIAFLDDYARQRNKPLVLCFCLGTNQGDHEGGSYLAQMLNNLMGTEGRMVVCGAGNEALHRHHFWGFSGENDTITMEMKIGEGVGGVYVESYVTSPQGLKISVNSPTGERYEGVISGEKQGYYRFRVEDTQIYQKVETVVGERTNRLVRTFFRNPTPGIWKLMGRISDVSDGVLHSWLPLEEQLPAEVVFIHSDPDTTVVEPGNAPLLLTVAAYDTITEGIFIKSGRGYSKSDVVKPELSAPGVELVSPYLMESESSTSAAAAVVSGASVLFLEWAFKREEKLRGVDVKERLLFGSRKKEEVTYPNREWGYGMLCLRDSFYG